mgnify:CR=1 FL=1
MAGDVIDVALSLATAVLIDIDRTCSRFRDDSDLVAANNAAGDWTTVDPLLITVVHAALRAAEASGGLVDPTLGVVLRSLGYDADFDALDAASVNPGRLRAGFSINIDVMAAVAAPNDPSHLDLTATDLALPTTGGRSWRLIETDDGLVSGDPRIRVPDGVALDLGAVGKAFAVDAVAAALAAQGLAAIVSIGGDVAVAPGPARHPWRVDISEAPGGPVQQHLIITEGAVATSTTTHRRWRHEGRIAHHIVDPRTGRPAAEVWRSVSATAATAVDANTATTAAIVLGHGAPDWLRGLGLAARLVGVDGHVVTTGGWPTDELP